jgi:hypothetical protein
MVGSRLRKAMPWVAAVVIAFVLSATGFAAGTASSGVNRRAIFREILEQGPEWAHSMMKKESLCDNPKETKHWNKKHAVRISACGLK